MNNKIKLDGFWDFSFSENNENIPKKYHTISTVPGCFDTMPGLRGKRGIGAYRRIIDLDKNFNYQLILHGVAHNASIYLDGKKLKDHHGAFTAIIINQRRSTETGLMLKDKSVRDACSSPSPGPLRGPTSLMGRGMWGFPLLGERVRVRGSSAT